MNKAYRYESDGQGNQVMFHDRTGFWFAYAHGEFSTAVRGKGRTKEEAIADSIKNTRED